MGGRAPRKYAKASARDAGVLFRPQWRRDRPLSGLPSSALSGQSSHRIHRQEAIDKLLPYLIGHRRLGSRPRTAWSSRCIHGGQGWTFDRSGVTRLPAASISEFRNRSSAILDNLCGCGLREAGASPSARRQRHSGPQNKWIGSELATARSVSFACDVECSTHFCDAQRGITKDEEKSKINEGRLHLLKISVETAFWTPCRFPGTQRACRSIQNLL